MQAKLHLLFATILALASWHVQGELKTHGARDAPAPSSSQSAPATSGPAAPFVVKLERVGARGLDGAASSHASFYVGSVFVGEPAQEMKVLFDTGSGHVLLPHKVCKSKACQEHRSYAPWESKSALDVNIKGTAVQAGSRLAKGLVNRSVATLEFTQADLGEGKAKGVLVRDQVCLGSPSASGPSQACAKLAILAATSMDDVPFRAMPHDGIVGLGLEGLAVTSLSSFYERLMDGSQALLPQFGISLGAASGEISFGGHDSRRLAAPIQWFPVIHPGQGFWQVAIKSVRVGNETVDSCPGGCRGIVDTGSSRLGVQANRLQKLKAALVPLSPRAAGQCQGPDIHLDLGEGFSLTLGPEDYAGAACEPQLGELQLDEPEFVGTFALGTSVLRRYYAAFDWAQARVGFAPSSTGRPLRVATSVSTLPKLERKSATVLVF